MTGLHDKGNRRGSALVTVLLALMVLMGMAGAVMTISRSARNELRSAEADMRALYLAETGVSASVASLISSGDGDVAEKKHAEGSYWADATPDAVTPDVYEILSRGIYNRTTYDLEAVVRRRTEPAYDNAIFAGNSSGDPTYTLELAGVGASADDVDGDVYSGGDASIQDDALVNGTIRAAGGIVGAPGETGVVQSPPDVLSMNYESNHDVDVATEFGSSAWQLSLSAGDFADQLPEANPAHIFRRNPLSRVVQTGLTAKDDYFLEDPYEPLGTDLLHDGSNPFPITISGVGGEPGPNGNDLVYYVDGNLWVMNSLTNSFQFQTSDGTPVRVTLVVKGNIYLADNLYYQDPAVDGLAMIAIEDPLVPDSGNVYMGDLLDGTVGPVLGSLKHMDSFLYAQNDFHDNNLDHLGLGSLEVNGGFAAGNQIHYERDLVVLRSPLDVNHDPRISDGSLVLPGIPLGRGGLPEYELLSMRRALD